MNAAVTASHRWLLAVLLLGGAFVAAYDLTLAPVRYPYAADSASYIEMADSLYHQGRPLVTPWDFAEGEADQIPQRLFPPGFAVAIAVLIPFTGEARTAALWPSRVAAALLPCLILFAFRGLLGDAALATLALFALATPGVRGWQFLAYSDVLALAVAVLALGALARGQGLIGAHRAPAPGWLVGAGLAAGAAYATRNAGLAVLAASVLSLGVQALRERGGIRALAWWAAGLAPPLVALWSYNLATFGRLQPYTMPASTRVWYLNVGDYALAQLTDVGLPWQAAEHMPPALAAAVMALLAAGVALAWWRLRADARRQGLVTLLGGYAFGGALLLILSRSRYEWGGLIDVRNTLQYSWALALVVALAVAALGNARARCAAQLLGVLLLAWLALSTAAEVRTVRAGGPEFWQVLAQDRAVMAAAAAQPAQALVASNYAVLFRIGAGRAVRQLEISGDDKDFAGSLGVLAAAAGARPAVLLLVCDDWTQHYSACGGAPRAGLKPPDCTQVRREPPGVLLCRPGRGS